MAKDANYELCWYNYIIYNVETKITVSKLC